MLTTVTYQICIILQDSNSKLNSIFKTFSVSDLKTRNYKKAITKCNLLANQSFTPQSLLKFKDENGGKDKFMKEAHLYHLSTVSTATKRGKALIDYPFQDTCIFSNSHKYEILFMDYFLHVMEVHKS